MGWKGPHPDLGSPGNVRSESLRVDRLRQALMPEQQAQTVREQWADEVAPENRNAQESREAGEQSTVTMAAPQNRHTQ